MRLQPLLGHEFGRFCICIPDGSLKTSERQRIQAGVLGDILNESISRHSTRAGEQVHPNNSLSMRKNQKPRVKQKEIRSVEDDLF